MKKSIIIIAFVFFSLATIVSAEENQTIATEQVKCIFLNSNMQQKCYSYVDNQAIGCSGVENCLTDISGEIGKKLFWKSTCGGYAETTIDGQNEEISFTCKQVPIPATTIPNPVPTVTTSNPVPATTNPYPIPAATVPNPVPATTNPYPIPAATVPYPMPGQNPVCGNAICEGAYEMTNCPMDCGIKCNQDSDCGQPIMKTTCNPPVPPAVKEYPSEVCTYKIKYRCENSRCINVGGKSCTPCQSGCQNGFCIEPRMPMICVDNDGIDYYKQGKACPESYCETDKCEGNTVIEFVCDGDYAKMGSTYVCPNGCRDGACITGEKIREKITCIFKNSDKEEKCFIRGGSITPEYAGKDFCMGKDNCVLEYESDKGRQITLKSTCGGYQYTTQDGIDESVSFECKTGETNLGEIQGQGFRFAYWQCYDGSESKAEDITSCKPSELWQKYAAEFCKDKCYPDKSKCGVNSFSISNDCYAENMVPVPIGPITGAIPAVPIPTGPIATTNPAIPVPVGPVGENVPTPEKAIETPIEPITICKDSCPADNKCYPFGYRKSGKFCSDQGKFIEQLVEETICENNFECGSNVCVDGKCMSSGFIQKIINWFRNLLGVS